MHACGVWRTSDILPQTLPLLVLGDKMRCLILIFSSIRSKIAKEILPTPGNSGGQGGIILIALTEVRRSTFCGSHYSLAFCSVSKGEIGPNIGIQHSVSLMQSDQLPQGSAAVAFPAMMDCNLEMSAQVAPFSIMNHPCHVNSHNRETGQWLY